ncbi:MAG: signal peptidase II [Bacilli bacterium]
MKKIINYLKLGFSSMIWVFFIVFIVDLGTKLGFQHMLQTPGTSVTLIPGFLHLTLLYNTGAGFGIFGNLDNDALRRTLLIGISIIMSGAFLGIYIWKYKKLNAAYKVNLMLLLGGAFGNLIDRAFYPNGRVIDFIDVDLGSYTSFPIFNIADAALVIGVIMMMIMLIIDEIKEIKGKKAPVDGSSLNEEHIEEKTIIEVDESKGNDNNNEKNNNNK